MAGALLLSAGLTETFLLLFGVYKEKNMIVEAVVCLKFCIFAAYSFNRIMERY